MAKKSLDELLNGVKVFGLYTVLHDGPHHPKSRIAVCKCECGRVKNVAVDKLRSGRSTRCWDCAKINPARVTNETHKKSYTAEYQAWASMKARCSNPNIENYPLYGGRGISVCESWSNSFDAFWDDMGPRPDGHTLDRVDSDDGYNPKNCRWATVAKQQQNRRVTKKAIWRGKEYLLSVLERMHKLPRSVLARRLDMGWDLDRALSDPALIKKPKHRVHGEFLTTLEILKKYGIERQSFNRRIRQGWTAQDAVDHYRQ